MRAGGRVYPLLGNHEFMRMIWDWRYVSAEELAAFRTGQLRRSPRAHVRVWSSPTRCAGRKEEQQLPLDEAAFHAQFVKDIPLGYIEMRQAFLPTGEYGKWLRERYALVRINGIVFLHGGISAATAALGCAGINDAVRRDLAVPTPTPEEALAMLSSSETGPLWYRGLAEEPEPAFAPALTNILELLGARAIVSGTPCPADFRITRRFDGRVIQIDTGMLGGTFYPGGMPSALEIRGTRSRRFTRAGGSACRSCLVSPAPFPRFRQRRPGRSARTARVVRTTASPLSVNSTGPSPRSAIFASNKLDDDVAPRRARPELRPRETPAHGFVTAVHVSRRMLLQQRPLNPQERSRPLQVVSEPEGRVWSIIHIFQSPVHTMFPMFRSRLAMSSSKTRMRCVCIAVRSGSGPRASFASRSFSSIITSSIHQVTAAPLPSTRRSTDIGTLSSPSSTASRYPAMLYR